MAVPDGRAVPAQRRRHPSGAHPFKLADRKRLEKPDVRTFPRKSRIQATVSTTAGISQLHSGEPMIHLSVMVICINSNQRETV